MIDLFEVQAPLRAVPVTIKQAQAFVRMVHRHLPHVQGASSPSA